MLGAYAVFVFLTVFLGLWHQNHLGFYEMVTPFLLLPGMGYLMVKYRFRPESWFLMLAVAAILGLGYATFQIFELNLGRAQGAVGNPITFGNSALVLAALLLIAFAVYPFQGKFKGLMRFALLVGGLAGMGASLLSGTKGGWLSVLTVVAVVLGLSFSHLSKWQRWLAITVGFVLVSWFAWSLPKHVIQDRFMSGANGAIHYIQTGEVTEGSVSVRFEMWRLSATIFSEAPLIGHGTQGFRARWIEWVDSGRFDPQLREIYTSDNELLGSLAGGGLVGTVGLLSVYIGIFLSFWMWRRHSDKTIRALSAMGMILSPLYLEFGLSVAVLGSSMFRIVFVTLAVSLLALITVRVNQINEVKSAQ